MNVTKRDGSVVPYDSSKIAIAIEKCFVATGNSPVDEKTIADVLSNIPEKDVIDIEEIQDIVENSLMGLACFDEARAYILYRNERAAKRGRVVPVSVKQRFDDASKYFPTSLQQFQFFDKYSRFNWDTGTRETWDETIRRATDYLIKLSSNKLPAEVYQEIYDSMLAMQIMPSMRLLASAGPTADRNNISIYNCSFIPVDSLSSFVEALIISMNGCGVGYSVEKHNIDKLPKVFPKQSFPTDFFLIPDTTEGWAEALEIGIRSWMSGGDVVFDYSQIRPFGSILKTKGGTASGPEPLRRMLEHIREIIVSRSGDSLRPIDAHDIMCHVGGAAIAGGSRRSSMIALFSFDDEEMLNCKNGDLTENSQRYNSNNSAVWEGPKTFQEVFDFMSIVFKSGRGEPGIFSRYSASLTMPERRERVPNFGTNPCGEILLAPYEFCNLSVIVARPDDMLDTLLHKARLATIVGLIQSMATHFPGLRQIWRENAEKERLLGVDITGHMDCTAVRNPTNLALIKQRVIDTAEEYSRILGINMPAATTCVKPSGNSSQLLNTSSGMHPRHSPYYLRNVRVGAGSAMAKVLLDSGVPIEPLIDNPTQTLVATFPVKSPDHAIVNDDVTAMEMLDYWLMVKKNWTEHNPSITVTYRPHEVLDIIQWVYDNQKYIGGMTFYPHSGAKYSQVPYEAISRDVYERKASLFPTVEFSKLYKYESIDTTTAFQELACFAGVCEI